MKSITSIDHPRNHRVRVAVGVALLTGAVSAAPVAPNVAAPEPKPYNLFMGADLDIQQGKDFFRVRDVAGDTLVATVNGKMESIPTTAGPINLRVQRALKLASTQVTIANLKSDRVYTPANDPEKKFAREQPGMAGQAQFDLAQGHAAQAALAVSMAAPDSPGRPAMIVAANAAQATAVQAAGEMNGPQYNVGEYALKMQTELALKLFDAIEITFDVSAPALVTNPYIVIVAQYHDPNEAKGTAHNWIYARELDPIDHTPRKVTIRKGGFPKGFELEGYQVHLYDRGQELATNVAERQMALTRDEAFKYVLIEYLAAHKGANVPATPGLARLPPELRERLSAAQFTQTFYVKVTKDGLPAGTYVDPSCLQGVEDSYLQSVVANIRFKPALEKGRPVDGIALLKLSDLR